MNHPANSSRMIKSGWLKKQGGMVKTWHRRWFVLNGECLFYFSKEDDLRPLGTIYLPGNKVIQHSGIQDEAEKFLFEVVPGKIQPKMGPNHDTFLLCAVSDDERQEWMRAIRKVMFSSLGGAIFGQSLEETMAYEKKNGHRKIPYIVEQCIDFLYQYGTETEGIFRLPGRALLVRELCDRFDMGEKVKFDITEVDIHSVASLLKQYLRELPQCLIPYKMYQRFMNIAMKFQDTKVAEEKNSKIEELREEMTNLPVDNYNLLKYLCTFLHEVSLKTEINKMTALNLATVFGPNIIRHPNMDDNPSLFLLTTADISQQLAYMFINHNDQVFTIDYDEDNKVPVEELLNINDDEEISSQIMQPMMPASSSALEDLSGIVLDHPRDRHARSIPDSSLLFTLPINPDNETLNTECQSPASPSGDSPEMKENQSRSDDKSKPIPPIRKRQLRKKGSGSGSSSPEPNKGNSTPDQPNTPVNGLEYQSSMSADSEAVIAELKQQVEESQRHVVALRKKCDMLASAKNKSEDRVKNLSAERQRMQTMFEEHIKTLEEKHKAKLQDMCAKLDEEKTARTEAVQKIVELQTAVHKYQMRYGDISNT